MRFLHLIRPVMCVLPEVASPDRKVSKRLLLVGLVGNKTYRFTVAVRSGYFSPVPC